MAAGNGFVNLEQLRLLANSDLLKDQLLVYFDLKTQREVQVTTEINNLTRQLLDIIVERRSFIGELKQRLPKNVMAYKTRVWVVVVISGTVRIVAWTDDRGLGGGDLRDYVKVVGGTDDGDHGVGISNSLSESDKHTSLGEQV
nr:hypothetical protein [Tanacetum cinerariifolium]